MDHERFEQLVVEGYELLPEWVKHKIRNVALLVEDEPSHEVRAIEGLAEDETLLGYYHGVPLSERGELYGVGVTLPDTITIYRLPTIDMAEEELGGDATDEECERAIRQIVADTVWHEFAHHFGMNEEEVRAREQERGVSS